MSVSPGTASWNYGGVAMPDMTTTSRFFSTRAEISRLHWRDDSRRIEMKPFKVSMCHRFWVPSPTRVARTESGGAIRRRFPAEKPVAHAQASKASASRLGRTEVPGVGGG